MNGSQQTGSIERLNARTQPSVFLQLAALHKQTIQHGLLELLPVEMLACMFRVFSRLDEAGLWIIKDRQGAFAGFIAGCSNTRQAYIQATLRGGLLMWFRLLKAAIVNPAIRHRLLSVFLYPFKRRPTHASQETPPPNGSELIAIAVHPQMHSRGFGRQLVSCLELVASNQWRTTSLWVSTNANDPNSCAFYQKIGFHPACKIKHNNLTLQVFSKSLPAV